MTTILQNVSNFSSCIQNGDATFEDALSIALNIKKEDSSVLKEQFICNVFGYSNNINRSLDGCKLFKKYKKTEDDEELAALVKFLCVNEGSHKCISLDENDNLSELAQALNVPVPESESKTDDPIIMHDRLITIASGNGDGKINTLITHAGMILKENISLLAKRTIVKGVMIALTSKTNGESKLSPEVDEAVITKCGQRDVGEIELPCFSIKMNGLYITFIEDEEDEGPLYEPGCTDNELGKFTTRYLTAVANRGSSCEKVEETKSVNFHSDISKPIKKPSLVMSEISGDLKLDFKSLKQNAKGPPVFEEMLENETEDQYRQKLSLTKEQQWVWHKKLTSKEKKDKFSNQYTGGFLKFVKQQRDDRHKRLGEPEQNTSKKVTVKQPKKRSDFGVIEKNIDKSFIKSYIKDIKAPSTQFFLCEDGQIAYPVKLTVRLPKIAILANKYKPCFGINDCDYQLVICKDTPMFGEKDRSKDDSPKESKDKEFYFSENKECIMILTGIQYEDVITFEGDKCKSIYNDFNTMERTKFLTQLHNVMFFRWYMKTNDDFKSIFIVNGEIFSIGETLNSAEGALKKSIGKSISSMKDMSALLTENEKDLWDSMQPCKNKLVDVLSEDMNNLNIKDEITREYLKGVLARAKNDVEIFKTRSL